MNSFRKVKVGNILKFGGLGKNIKTLAKVTAVSSTSVIVAGVTTVAGVAEGFLPLGTMDICRSSRFNIGIKSI